MPRDDIQVIAVYHTELIYDARDFVKEEVVMKTLWTGDDYFYLPGDLPKESRAGRLLPWPQFEAILKEATLG